MRAGSIRSKTDLPAGIRDASVLQLRLLQDADFLRHAKPLIRQIHIHTHTIWAAFPLQPRIRFPRDVLCRHNAHRPLGTTVRDTVHDERIIVRFRVEGDHVDGECVVGGYQDLAGITIRVVVSILGPRAADAAQAVYEASPERRGCKLAEPVASSCKLPASRLWPGPRRIAPRKGCLQAALPHGGSGHYST